MSAERTYKDLGAVVVGGGGVARAHARLLAEHEIPVLSVVTTKPATADAMAVEFGGRAFGNGDVGGAIDHALGVRRQGKLFVVAGVTPASIHDVAEVTLGRGVSILAEKPFGTANTIGDIQRAEGLGRRAQQDGLANLAAYQYEHADSEVENRLHERLGTLPTVGFDGQWFGTRPEDSAWWTDPEKSGEQLNEQTTHMLRRLVGLVGPVEVVGGSEFRYNDTPAHEVADGSEVLLKIAKTGVQGVIRSYCRMPAGTSPEVFLRFDHGEDRTTTITRTALIIQDGKGDPKEYPYENPRTAMVQGFWNEVREGDPSEVKTSLTEAADLQNVVFLAKQEMKKNSTVRSRDAA